MCCAPVLSARPASPAPRHLRVCLQVLERWIQDAKPGISVDLHTLESMICPSSLLFNIILNPMANDPTFTIPRTLESQDQVPSDSPAFIDGRGGSGRSCA